MQLFNSKTEFKAFLYVVQHIKRYTNSENCSTFAPTVQTTLPVRTASQGLSFASQYIYFGIQDNAVARPLNDAHLATLFLSKNYL